MKLPSLENPDTTAAAVLAAGATSDGAGGGGGAAELLGFPLKPLKFNVMNRESKQTCLRQGSANLPSIFGPGTDSGLLVELLGSCG